MAKQHAVQRLLLVAVLAVGIAGMHTLGHPGGGGGHGSTTHTAARSAPQPAAGAVPEPMRHAAGHAAAIIAATGQAALRGMDMSLDPSTMCLAILVGFALAALLAALAFGCRRAVPFAHYLRDAVAVVGRGPPVSAPVGLRLADLSVLRT